MNTHRPRPFLVLALGLSFHFAGMNAAAFAQGWPGYALNPQHTCASSVQSQLSQAIHWSTPVDLNPQSAGNGALYIHYGSPVITAANTVIVPVKTGATNGFEVRAYSFNASTGVLTLLWTQATDYTVPSCSWIPICGITLTPNDSTVAVPGAGGTVYVRTSPNMAGGTTTQLAFYGIGNYNANPAAFDSAIQICTPITSDTSGNLYFGYISTGGTLPGYPSGIPSGLARISSGGSGTFTAATAMSGNSSTQSVLYNCSPALSNDGTIVYAGVSNISPGSPNNYGSGYLCALNSTTLVMTASVPLQDPRAGVGAANVTNYASASPTVGPDGDVYFGVLEGNFPSNNDRGWLLHFSGDLSATKLPGAFGWDDTASVVPASAVPSYTGTSPYLLLTKYNNYAGVGTGDGVNKLAVLDPNTSMTDPITGATVMNTVITVTGVTPDPGKDRNYPNAVREWCINSAAIDPAGKCAIVNSEDGHLYRWDFTTNSLLDALNLAPPTGEAYTPTAIGPDGAVYAINDATLYSAGVTLNIGVPAMPRWAVAILPLLLFLASARFLAKQSRMKAVAPPAV